MQLLDNINLDVLVLIILVAIFLTGITLLLREFLDRILLIIIIWGGSFFTSLGMVVKYSDNYSYIFSNIMFLIAMTFTAILVVRKRKFKERLGAQKIFEKYSNLFVGLGVIALLLQISSLIYPQFRLLDLFSLPEYVANANRFQERIANDNNVILWVIDRLKLMCLPFFFIWLYTLKDKPLKFISLFVFYQYIDFVKSNYISRSAVVVYIVFIWLYLYEEKVLSRKILLAVGVTVGVGIIPLINFLEVIRVGNVSSNNSTIFESLITLINKEGYNQQFLDVCNNFSHELNFGKYLISSISSPLFFLPDVDFPVLSYAFTERILGLKYGDPNYYILLPGAFGEGIMIFGKQLVWVYGAFIGYFVGKAYRIFSKIPFLKIWSLMYILDTARAFRGGIQTFFIATLNTSLLLVIVIISLNFLECSNN